MLDDAVIVGVSFPLHLPPSALRNSMQYRDLVILLPCHSLEDFPIHHEGDDAEGLLANWSAMWHPALIASAGKKPNWARVDDPPEEMKDKLILIPSVSIGELPTGFAQRAESEGALMIRKSQDRQEIVAKALAGLDNAPDIDPELVADFHALGYCYLQVELLTRQMRYSSNLDEIYFERQAVAGAQAAAAGNEAEAREKLSACFSVLAEERDHYYPVDAFVLDLTLVATTTVGESFRKELARDEMRNLLIGGEALAVMAAEEPESLAVLKKSVEEGHACLIGGEASEKRSPLVSCESILRSLQEGCELYQKHLGAAPKVFGRRRYGLSPMLPQILEQFGFTGALHATLDDGTFPEGSQIKTSWEGADGTVIDSLARAPIDATTPATYLSFAVKMGESMDMEHVATVCLAHWPGQTTVWLEDLRRVASYCPALGKFVSLEEYFENTEYAGHAERFENNAYRSPYLKQAIIRRHVDPLSSSVRYWKRQAKWEATEAINTLASLIVGDDAPLDSNLPAMIDDAAELPPAPKDEDHEENSTEQVGTSPEPLDEQLADALEGAAKRLAAALPRDDKSEQGVLVLNPFSFVRRVGISTNKLESLPKTDRPLYAADSANDSSQLVVDAPPMGFAWIAGDGSAPMSGKKSVGLIDGHMLRNEFLQATVNAETGALQSLHAYGSRTNRLSQQLGCRLDGRREGTGIEHPDELTLYSRMKVDDISVTANCLAMAEITVTGKMFDDSNHKLGTYQQKYQVWRGSRVLRLEIELDELAPSKADPWNSYYASRFAWRDESADIWRSQHQTRVARAGKRIESPHYVSIEAESQRTTIFTGGLPFHRRIGNRILDTLLVVRGERERKFTLGIGVDVKHPMNEALSLLSPPVLLPETNGAPKPSASSWLFHCDSRNVTATHWRPLIDEGNIVGFTVRLLETAGRPAKAGLSGFRAIESAVKVDQLGKEVAEFTVADGKAQIELAGSQWIEVQARWAK